MRSVRAVTTAASPGGDGGDDGDASALFVSAVSSEAARGKKEEIAAVDAQLEALAPAATPPSGGASSMMAWLTSGEAPRSASDAAEEGAAAAMAVVEEEEEGATAKAEKAAAEALDPDAALSRIDAFEVAGWERQMAASLAVQASRERERSSLDRVWAEQSERTETKRHEGRSITDPASNSLSQLKPNKNS